MDDRQAGSLIRWTAAVVGWAVLFVVAAVIAGMVARPNPSLPPIAAATSTPAPTRPSIATPIPTSPTSPQPTPSPTIGPGPSPTASVAPSGSASPTPASPSPAASPIAPSPSIVVLPSADPSTIPTFLDELAAAIRRGRDAYLLDHLHPAVIERFGEPACRSHIAASVSGGSARWEFIASSGPAPWGYASDGLETIIADAWTVSVREPGADPEERDLHFANVDATWRWFTDCGEPV